MAEVFGVVATTCLDICAGILLDFASLRHACTEDLCCCPAFCGCCNGAIRLEDTIPERESTRRPLPVDTQPSTQSRMGVSTP